MRFLSLLSGVVCRQNLLQQALKTSQRILLRFTQTQTVAAKTQQPLAATCGSPTSHTNGTDPSISLFYRPTKTFIDSCDITDHSAVVWRCSGEVVDVSFNESLKESLHDVQRKIRDETLDTEAIAVESVDELIHKELRPSYQHLSLLSLYSKLAKLRLTGTGSFCALSVKCIFIIQIYRIILSYRCTVQLV